MFARLISLGFLVEGAVLSDSLLYFAAFVYGRIEYSADAIKFQEQPLFIPNYKRIKNGEADLNYVRNRIKRGVILTMR